MGKKLDAFLGRNFKTSKFKPTASLAISRLAVLKNQRQVRCNQARSDVVQLLQQGHHDRAILRVEQVIKEQNMLDVFAMMEGYCNLLVERVHLVEQDRECPDELKEAISSLLFASTRCGEFPELQEIRAIFASRYGKEFVARATELRNNCGVNPKIIQKLSTRQPDLETRKKVLVEIASENSITLQTEEASSSTIQENLGIDEEQQISSENIGKDGFSDSMKAKKKYRDVADAAQAAFESAAHAAAAARAAVELSRSDSHDPDNQNSPKVQGKRLSKENESAARVAVELSRSDSRDPDNQISPKLKGKKLYMEDEPMKLEPETENKEIHLDNDGAELQTKIKAEKKISASTSVSDSEDSLKVNAMSSDGDDQAKELEDVKFDESDNDVANTKSSKFNSAFQHSMKSNKQIPSEIQSGIEVDSRHGNTAADPPQGSESRSSKPWSIRKVPFSVRTRQVRGY